MEIIKELNLNGNPQNVPTGSLVFAKNIKISDDGSYITNDDGFVMPFYSNPGSTYDDVKDDLKVKEVKGKLVAVEWLLMSQYYTLDSEEETIGGIKRIKTYYPLNFVGYINCPNEIVLFATAEYSISVNGKVTETGVDDIIFRAVESINEDKYYLFRVYTGWKYNNGSIIGTYTYNVYGHLIIGIAEYDADIDKQLLTIDLNESSNLDSLDKYSCAPNIPIADLSLIEKIKGNSMPHGLYYFFIRYEVSNKLYTNWFPIGTPQYALSLDYKTIFYHSNYNGETHHTSNKVTKESIFINTNKDSFYNFYFNLNLSDTYNYIGFQIGYILQTDDTTVGRIFDNFKLSPTDYIKRFVFNGGFIEEVSIEDLTKDVLNLYNVKALTSYNGKLYAANFKETNYNVNLKEYADGINAFMIKKVVDVDDVGKINVVTTTWSYTIDGTTFIITVPSDSPSIKITNVSGLVNALDSSISWRQQSSVIDELGIDTRLVFSTERLILTPSLPDPYYVADREYKRFWSTDSYYCFGMYSVSTPGGGGLESKGRLERNKVTISNNSHSYGGNRRAQVNNTEVSNYGTYTVDNIIRTLMPYEVYAFYVHYVRADGSYTNGIPLENKNDSYNLNLYKQIKDLSTSDLNFFNLNDLATITEIQNKYLYEFLITGQIFAKDNFEIYLDNNGKKLFRTNSAVYTKNDKTYLLRIGARFENVIIPPGYVGAFFSYEKVNSISIYQGYVTDNLESRDVFIVKANDVESANLRYDGALFIPQYKLENGVIKSVSSDPRYTYINNANPALSNSFVRFLDTHISRVGTHGGILMSANKSKTETYSPSVGTVGNIIVFNRAAYTNDVKELISFGPVVAGKEGEAITYGEYTEASIYAQINVEDTILNYNMNYPSFLSPDKILTYKRQIAINEEGQVNLIADNVVNTKTFYDESEPYANITTVWKFSNINLLALSIKKEPEMLVGVRSGDDANIINEVVQPVNASDLFKFESCYIPQIHKAYTNYNENIKTPNTFTNVIRASYPIRNESNINSWRLFNPLSYYVIDNSKGEIVNIFGAGSSFYIHTKNNLLVTSSNAKLAADNETIHIEQNNVFDVEPTELFTSDLGYGGIKYQECQLFSQFGYIWYDTDRRTLFRYDNGRLININDGIGTILKKYNFEKCYINIDNKSNRIFFSFDTCIKNIYDESKRRLTLSYNMLSAKWLSINDFYFTKSIHTINKAVFSDLMSFYIYGYDYTSLIYYTLFSQHSDFPTYNYVPRNRTYHICKSCFDVIFNERYMTPKVLESISWAFEKIKPLTLDKDKISQLEIVNNNIIDKYHDLDDVSLLIYSDSVDSGLISLEHGKLNDVANVNNPNAYKYPYYDKGVWNLSYFRNNITTEVTDEELETIAQQHNIPVSELKGIYKVMDKNGNPIYRKSDLRSLIYGKYIVCRFILSNWIKFDNLVFNINKY